MRRRRMPSFGKSRSRFGRAAWPASLVAAALLTPLSGVVEPARPAGADPGAADSTSATVAEARRLAKETNQPQVVGSMLTETRTVEVNPSGSFTATESLRPVRAKVGGRWQAIDTTLVRDGSWYRPRASTLTYGSRRVATDRWCRCRAPAALFPSPGRPAFRLL